MRRKNQESRNKNIEDGISIGGFILIYFLFIFLINKQKFWYQINHYILPLIGIVVIIIFVYFYKKNKDKTNKKKHLELLIKTITENNLEGKIINFIQSFGKEKVKKILGISRL